MERIAVLGGGELGATIVRRLAELELAREVVLVEADEERARGKALDLMQSGPIVPYDTRVVGAGAVTGTFEALVVADPDELQDGTVPKAFVDALVAACGEAALVVAGADPRLLVETAVNRGLRRDRVIGSAPVADAAAVARALAGELDVEPSAVCVTVLGAGGRLIVPAGGASVAGLPAEGLSPVAVRRALAEAQRGRRGPVALAAAAARVVRALAGRRDTVIPVMVVLQGELGVRNLAIAAPARIAAGRVHAVLEPALEPVDRVALDNLAAGRARP